MNISLFSLFACWVSGAYLASWLISMLYTFFSRVKAGWIRQHAAGKVLSLKAHRSATEKNFPLLWFVGGIAGMVMALFFGEILIKEWMLVTLSALAILSEGWRVTKRDLRVLEAAAFFG